MSLSALFEHAVSGGAHRDFIHVPLAAARLYSAEAITLSYEEAAERVARLAGHYRASGLERGHRVGLAFDNRPDFFLHWLALNRLGASVVPLNGAMSRDELAFVLTHSDAALAVAHEGHASRIKSALPAGCGFAVGAGAEGLDEPRCAPAAIGSEVALLYTSGTTGTPKACILDQGYFDGAGEHYLSIGGHCEFRSGEDRLITPLPVTHMNALACSFLAMLRTGGCLVQLDRFHPSTWWECLLQSRATCFHYLGVMPAMLLSAAPRATDKLPPSVRFGFGAGVDPKHHAAFEQRFGVPLIEAWAMTETGGGAWLSASHEPRHVGERCFGRAPPGLAWRLVDEAGTPVAAGAIGELQVRRAAGDPRRGFFAGYYKDQPATEAAWEEGWFHTGDIVRQGADGSFYFVDRLKNVIRRSGENIAALEVESILQQLPGVAACAVTAVPDEMRGEEVFAFIVPRGAGGAARQFAEDLQAACLRELVYYKAPGYVLFVDELPQTASQKVARGEVKRRAASAAGSGAAIDLRIMKKRPEADRG